MKNQTFNQLLALESLKEKGQAFTILDILNRIQDVSKSKPFGSVAFHESCPFSTATMQHPYLFLTEDYEEAKREHLKYIESVKSNPDYKVERLDEENIRFSYTFEDEYYGTVTQGESLWLEEAPKLEPFTSFLNRKAVLISLRSEQSNSFLVGAFQSMESATIALDHLLIQIRHLIPAIQLEVTHYGERIHYYQLLNADRDQKFTFELEVYPVESAND